MTLKMNIFFAFLGILFILLAGCISPQTLSSTPVTSPSTPTATLAETPTPTVILTTPISTPAPTPVSFSDDDINNHFVSIAFGRTNSYLEKVTTTSAHKIQIYLKGESTPDDVTFITKFGEKYNEITQTETFHDPVRILTSDQPYSIQIGFYPPDYLKSIDEGIIRYKYVDPDTGDSLYIVTTGYQYYINSNLADGERNHFIMRAILDYFGFTGETYDYSDSFFYANNEDGTNLSSLDKAAINVMYKPILYRGMSIEDVKNALTKE